MGDGEMPNGQQHTPAVAFAPLPYGFNQLQTAYASVPGFYHAPLQPVLAGFMPAAMPADQPSSPALATQALPPHMLSYMMSATHPAMQQTQPAAMQQTQPAAMQQATQPAMQQAATVLMPHASMGPAV